MAWKKIIVSGSQASLNSVAVDSSVSAGSITSTGDISGSNLKLTGNANIDGNIVLGGSINLGDNVNDNIIIGGEISSSVVPDADGTYDLGSDAKRWRNVYGDTIYGDGSNLTNVTVSQAATVASTFSNQTSVAVTHNFDSKNVTVAVYNSSDVQILPASVTLTSNDIATVTFDSSTSGRVVVAKGGHILSGSAQNADFANNGFPFTGSAEITGSLTVTGSGDFSDFIKAGPAKISHDSNFAKFSHEDRDGALNYSFMSSPNGSTYINASGSSQKVNILDGNGSVATFEHAETSLHSLKTIVRHKDAFEIYTDPSSGPDVKTFSLGTDGTGSFTGPVSASHFLGDFIGDGSQLTNIPASALGGGIVSSSVISSPSQGTARLAVNGVNTDADLGLQAGDSPTFSSLTLTGNLTVQGTTTSIETANLLVEDKFILVNSGSAAADGGLVVNGAGVALGWDNSAGRWSTDSAGATANQTTITTDAFLAGVVDIDAGHADIAAYQKNGNVKTDSGEIYIYS